MGACYGDGILGFVPGGIEGEEEQIEFVKQFASSGLSHCFREVIGDRVGEFSYKKGTVKFRWLTSDEAEPILADCPLGGSAPYSLLSAVVYSEAEIFVPGFRGSYQVSLDLPGHPFDGKLIGPLRNEIASSEEDLREMRCEGVDRYDIEFLENLLESYKLCRMHRLIFTFRY